MPKSVLDIAVGASGAGGNVWLIATPSTGMPGAVYRMNGNSPQDIDTSGNPFSNTLNGQAAYWTASQVGTIRRLLPGGVVETVKTGETDCQAIASSPSELFWIKRGAGQVRSLQLDTLTQPPRMVADGENRPFSLVADKDGLCWFTADGLLRCIAGGQPPKTVYSGLKNATAANYGKTIALTATDIFFASIDDGRILRIARRRAEL